MKTAEDVMKELLDQGFTMFEIMCSLDIMEKQANGNDNSRSLKSLNAEYGEFNPTANH